MSRFSKAVENSPQRKGYKYTKNL